MRASRHILHPRARSSNWTSGPSAQAQSIRMLDRASRIPATSAIVSMPKMNTRCALPSTAPLLHARMEGTTNAETLHAIAPNTMATASKRSPRSGAATIVKHTPNTMIAHAANTRPTSALADAVPAIPIFSSNARPADVNGRRASPCRSPSPITAPMVAAAATVPTRSPTEIRESLIAPKGNGPGGVAQGHVVTRPTQSSTHTADSIPGKQLRLSEGTPCWRFT